MNTNPEEIAFYLEINDYIFVFTVEKNQPGKIFTATYDEDDEGPHTREPTDEEMDIALNTTMSAQLRIELVLEAGKRWGGEWQTFSNKMFAQIMTKFPAAEA